LRGPSSLRFGGAVSVELRCAVELLKRYAGGDVHFREGRRSSHAFHEIPERGERDGVAVLASLCIGSSSSLCRAPGRGKRRGGLS
jgi:hypothetical protein